MCLQVFRDQISRYREAVYLLTGYKIDLKKDTQSSETHLRLRSMYSEYESDDLLFRMVSTKRGGAPHATTSVSSARVVGGNNHHDDYGKSVEEMESNGNDNGTGSNTSSSCRLELLETDLAGRLDKKLVVYLTTCHSIPAFLSNLTLHLFEQQTFQG
jgi:mitotic spindle assembly checkpoint protein MAD1